MGQSMRVFCAIRSNSKTSANGIRQQLRISKRAQISTFKCYGNCDNMCEILKIFWFIYKAAGEKRHLYVPETHRLTEVMQIKTHRSFHIKCDTTPMNT